MLEKEQENKDNKVVLPDERAAVTEHQLHLGEQAIDYRATAGIMHRANGYIKR